MIRLFKANLMEMKNILLIDPVEISLRLTKRYLENQGYIVDAC